jgi:NAD-dependent deacetylase
MPIQNRPRYFILTGAGISAASGLRTFRGTDGMIHDKDVLRLSQKNAVTEDIEGVWQLFGSMRNQALSAQPNTAHRALAEFERRNGPRNTLVVTQNLDGLHQRAGSKNVLEFHGSLLRSRCRSRHCETAPFSDHGDHTAKLPSCSVCGEALRPDVVMFGEPIPAEHARKVGDWIVQHNVFIAVGTSLLVTPAAHLVRLARQHGATTISVNCDPPSEHMSEYFDEHVSGPIHESLPKLLKLLSD